MGCGRSALVVLFAVLMHASPASAATVYWSYAGGCVNTNNCEPKEPCNNCEEYFLLQQRLLSAVMVVGHMLPRHIVPVSSTQLWYAPTPSG